MLDDILVSFMMHAFSQKTRCHANNNLNRSNAIEHAYTDSREVAIRLARMAILMLTYST